VRFGLISWTSVLAGVFLACPVLGQEQAADGLTYNDVLRVQNAFSRLAKMRGNLSCFKAIVSHEGNRTKVYIYPADNSRVDADKVTLNTSPCGAGAVFIYDASGKLVQTIYAR
jgi:hypothetical protein